MNPQFEITIDGEPYNPPEKAMTSNEILALANLSNANYYLVELTGNAQHSYEGQGDETIHLHPGSKFISVFTGPTPVSDTNGRPTQEKLVGAALFAHQLREAEYAVTELNDSHVIVAYKVPTGKFNGLEVNLGFVVPPDFPLTPPTGPHVEKDLHPICSGGSHPTGGIHPSDGHSAHFKRDWQYWSRPYQDWRNGEKTAVKYMSFVHMLWATQ